MIQHETKIRVRYAETDKMGYVYYGNYATFFEVARVELLRSLGISYKALEDDGIMLPVLEYNMKYFKPAKYDDVITIRTTLKSKSGVRITFNYECFNEGGEMINQGMTTLVFVSVENGKPIKQPQRIKKVFEPYFIEQI